MGKLAVYITSIRNILKQNNGIIGSIVKLYRIDDFKWGNQVGEDKFGNKYFQNTYYFMGRSRWVEFSPKVGLEYDASQIPPEWHRWLQYISDETPTDVPLPRRKWVADHTENLSGTSKEYVPYSTTTPKIEAWVPKK